MKRIVRKTVGIALVIVGLLALITPVTPGSWLIPIGLELLGLRILLAGKLLAWARARPGTRLERIIRKVLRVKESPSESPVPRRLERGDQDGNHGRHSTQ